MINYNIANLKNQLEPNKNKVILFGAGDIGELSNYSLNKLGIVVDFFCDNDPKKHGSKYLGVEVISMDALKKLDKNVNVLISNNYVITISKELKKEGFNKVYNCSELLKNTDFSKPESIGNTNWTRHPLKLSRRLDYYSKMCSKDEFVSKGLLNIKSLDVQITERCSLKCVDCSNLMQYYERPTNTNLDQLFLAVDRFMSCVNKIHEFRVIGGDPFMNKEMHKVVDRLKKYDQVEKIVIYTNAKIIPKGDNLACLKHKKVILDISNYGEVCTNHDAIIKVLEENNILYTTNLVSTWQDCGRILPFQKRTEEENKIKFTNCCNSEVLSILHGKFYRCPFSANAHNLRAIPENKSDVVDLCDEKTSIIALKEKIKDLVYNKDFLTACLYCNGRDYTVAEIKSAQQTRKPLQYKRI